MIRMFNNSLRVSLDFKVYFIVNTYRGLNFWNPQYVITEKKNLWKLTNFLVMTNIFPRPKILPD